MFAPGAKKGSQQTLELLAEFLGHESNNVLGAIACIFGGCIGALVWGFGFGGPFGMTSSWTAMVIGILIAVVTLLFRGRGLKMAALAVVVTFAAMAGGRFFGAYLVLNRDWGWRDRQTVAIKLSQTFNTTNESSDWLRSLKDFKDLKGDEATREFITKYNFEIGKPDGQVSETELEQFKQYWSPMLKSWTENLPKRTEIAGKVMDVHVKIYEAEFKANTPLADIATYDLDIIDILFALFGALVAGGIVMLVSGKLELKRETEERHKREMAERAPLPKLAPAKKKPQARGGPPSDEAP